MIKKEYLIDTITMVIGLYIIFFLIGSEIILLHSVSGSGRGWARVSLGITQLITGLSVLLVFNTFKKVGTNFSFVISLLYLVLLNMFFYGLEKMTFIISFINFFSLFIMFRVGGIPQNAKYVMNVVILIFLAIWYFVLFNYL